MIFARNNLFAKIFFKKEIYLKNYIIYINNDKKS